MTLMVQTLIADGLVTKAVTRQRRQSLTLTRKGIALTGRLHVEMDAIEKLVYASLPDRQARQEFLTALINVTLQCPTTQRGRPLFRVRR